MSLSLGSTTIGSIYLGSTKVGSAYLGNVKVYEARVDPYNPLRLPAFTMRIQFGTGNYNPTSESSNFWKSGTVWTQVSSSPNVWDYYNPNTSWAQAFENKLNHERTDTTKYIYILGANLTGVTSIASMFRCTSQASSTSSWVTGLKSVCLFDTSDVTGTGWGAAFNNNDLWEGDIPDFPINSGVTNVNYAFANCKALSGGIKSMYDKMSAISGITSHTATFINAGSNTTSGAAELALVPSDWKS